MNRQKIDGKYDYFAFISYTDEDTEKAQWMKRILTHYRFPADIREERNGLPSWIRPVFEWKTDTSGGDMRGSESQIQNALFNSKYLIVICSPDAVRSEPVNREIQDFIKWGREKNIIPFIICGKPHAKNPEEECFPPALLGLIGNRERKGIFIDNINEDYAAISVISTMFDIKVNDLWKPYERERKRLRRRKIGSIIGVISIIAVFSFIFALSMSRKNALLEEINFKMLENQSRAVAEKAYSLIDEGDSYLASLLALEILPNDSFPNRPYTVEAEKLLRESLMKETAMMKSNQQRNVGFSPDGMRFIMGTSIWDLKSGCKIYNFDETIHKWHPSGKYIVTTIGDTIKIRNSFSGKCVKQFLGHEKNVSFVTFNSQGSTMVSGGEDNTIRIWNTSNGECIKSFAHNMNGVVYFDYLENGKYFIAVSNDSTISVWNSKSFELIRKIHTNVSPSSDCVSCSPSEDIIALTHVYSDCIYFWNISRRTLERTIKTNSYVEAIQFSRDGKKIIVGGRGIDVYDVQTQVGHKICETPSSVVSFSLSPNGRHLIATSFIDDNFRLLDLNPDSGELLLQHTDSIRVHGVFCTKDVKYVGATDNNGNLFLWNICSGKNHKRYKLKKSLFGIYSHSVQVHPFNNDAVFLSHENIGKVINLDSGNLIVTLEGRIEDSMFLRYCDNGKYVIGTVYEWGGTKIWDSKTGKLICNFINGSNNIYTDKTIPNRGLLISVMNDSIICLNNIKNQTVDKILKGSSRKIKYLEISYNGNYIASMSTDSTICVWDVSKGCCIHTMKGVNSDRKLIVFSDDEKLFATQGIDNSILVWNTQSGALVNKIVGHKYDLWRVDGICFSPNGKYLLSSSKDKTIRLWEVYSGGCLRVINSGTGMNSAFFSPDGTRLIYQGKNGWVVDNYFLHSLDSLISKTRSRFRNRKLTTEEKRRFYLE